MQFLSESAKGNVRSILGITSLEDASIWMDEIRVTPQYDYMKPWHYINISRGEQYNPKERDNIIYALNKAISDLNSTKTEERKRKEALMILIHLVGDLHQPLHVGYGDDRGGNAIEVNYEGHLTNLHHIWDTDILRHNRISKEQVLEKARELKTTGVEKGSIVSWMEEGRTLLPSVYDFPARNINDAYMRKQKPVVESQLAKAGIRLAYLLNQALTHSGVETGANGVSLTSDTELTPQQAAQHIGETARVCGKVFSGKYLKDKAVTFINMGADYPNNPFTAVIFGRDREKFGAAPEKVYTNLNICVSGQIKEHNGKPQIIVSDEEQIQIQ